MNSVIRPLIKNKFGDIHDSSYYREILISSYLFNIFEMCLLPIFQRYISTSNDQFGYKSNTSTNLSTAVLNEGVVKYINEVL